MKPDFEHCQECRYWDDINGCWKDITNIEECPFIDEEGMFFDDESCDII